MAAFQCLEVVLVLHKSGMILHATLGLNAGRQVAKQAAGHPVIEFWTSQTENSEGTQPSSGPDTCRYFQRASRHAYGCSDFCHCFWGLHNVRVAVLCCAVLCCAVLCCAVLCCAVLCCAVLCWLADHTCPGRTFLHAAWLKLDICDVCTCVYSSCCPAPLLLSCRSSVNAKGRNLPSVECSSCL